MQEEEEDKVKREQAAEGSLEDYREKLERLVWPAIQDCRNGKLPPAFASSTVDLNGATSSSPPPNMFPGYKQPAEYLESLLIDSAPAGVDDPWPSLPASFETSIMGYRIPNPKKPRVREPIFREVVNCADGLLGAYLPQKMRDFFLLRERPDDESSIGPANWNISASGRQDGEGFDGHGHPGPESVAGVLLAALHQAAKLKTVCTVAMTVESVPHYDWTIDGALAMTAPNPEGQAVWRYAWGTSEYPADIPDERDPKPSLREGNPKKLGMPGKRKSSIKAKGGKTKTSKAARKLSADVASSEATAASEEQEEEEEDRESNEDEPDEEAEEEEIMEEGMGVQEKKEKGKVTSMRPLPRAVLRTSAAANGISRAAAAVPIDQVAEAAASPAVGAAPAAPDITRPAKPLVQKLSLAAHTAALSLGAQVASLKMTVPTALAVCMESLSTAEAALCTLPGPLLRAGFLALVVDVTASILTVANWPDESRSSVILAELVMAPAPDLEMTTTEGLLVRLTGLRLTACCWLEVPHPLIVAGKGAVGSLGNFTVSIEPLDAPSIAPSPVHSLSQNVAIKFFSSPLDLAALLQVLTGVRVLGARSAEGHTLDGATQGGFELRQAAGGSLLHLDRVYASVDTGSFSWNSLLPGKLGSHLLGQTKIEGGTIELSVYQPAQPTLSSIGLRLDDFKFTAASGAEMYASMDRVPCYDDPGQPPVLEYVLQLEAAPAQDLQVTLNDIAGLLAPVGAALDAIPGIRTVLKGIDVTYICLVLRRDDKGTSATDVAFSATLPPCTIIPDVLEVSKECQVDIKWDYCSEEWTGGFSGGVTLFGKLNLDCKVVLPSAGYLGTAELTLSEDDDLSLQALVNKLGFDLPDTGVLNPKEFLGVKLKSLVLMMAIDDSHEGSAPAKEAQAQTNGNDSNSNTQGSTGHGSFSVCGVKATFFVDKLATGPLSLTNTEITLTKWMTDAQQALYGSGVAFNLKGTVGMEDSKLRIQLCYTPDTQAPLAKEVTGLKLQPPFKKLQTAVSNPGYAVYGSVEFIGCDEPGATPLAGSIGHLSMDPDNAASNQGGSDLLLHKSFMTAAAPYAVTLGYSDSHKWMADLVIAGSFSFLNDKVTLTALRARVEESAAGVTFKVSAIMQISSVYIDTKFMYSKPQGLLTFDIHASNSMTLLSSFGVSLSDGYGLTLPSGSSGDIYADLEVWADVSDKSLRRLAFRFVETEGLSIESVAKKIGMPWLLDRFDILLKDIQLIYMPKPPAAVNVPPELNAGFMLACTCDIPAISAKGVNMILVVTSTLKKFVVQASWEPVDNVKLLSGEIHVNSAHSGLMGTLAGKLFDTIDVEVSLMTGPLLTVSCRVLNVDFGKVVETALPSYQDPQLRAAMGPILTFLKAIKFRSIILSYVGSKLKFAAMPDLSSAPGINDIFQALKKLDSNITQDSLVVTEDSDLGLVLSLQGVSVQFAPGNPFEQDLTFAFVLKYGGETFEAGCTVDGYLRMGNSAKPDQGHTAGTLGFHIGVLLRRADAAAPITLGLDFNSLGPYSLPGFPYVSLNALFLRLDVPLGEPIPSRLVFSSGEEVLGAKASTTVAYDPAAETFGLQTTMDHLDPQEMMKAAGFSVDLGDLEMDIESAILSFATKDVNVNSGGRKLSIKQGMELGATFSLFKGMIACQADVKLQPLLIDLELNFMSDEITKIAEKVLDAILDLMKDMGNKLLSLLHAVMIEQAAAQTAVSVAKGVVTSAETAYNGAVDTANASVVAAKKAEQQAQDAATVAAEQAQRAAEAAAAAAQKAAEAAAAEAQKAADELRRRLEEAAHKADPRNWFRVAMPPAAPPATISAVATGSAAPLVTTEGPGGVPSVQWKPRTAVTSDSQLGPPAVPRTFRLVQKPDNTWTWNLPATPLDLSPRQEALQQLASADSSLDAEINSMVIAVSAAKMTPDNMNRLQRDIDNFKAQQGTNMDLYRQKLSLVPPDQTFNATKAAAEAAQKAAEAAKEAAEAAQRALVEALRRGFGGIHFMALAAAGGPVLVPAMPQTAIGPSVVAHVVPQPAIGAPISIPDISPRRPRIAVLPDNQRVPAAVPRKFILFQNLDNTWSWNQPATLPDPSPRQEALQQLALADTLLNAEINSMLTAVNGTKMTSENMDRLLLDVDNFWAQQGACIDLYYQKLGLMPYRPDNHAAFGLAQRELAGATTPQARDLAQAKINLMMATTPEQGALAQAHIDLATPTTTPENRRLAQAQIDLAYAEAQKAEVEKGPKYQDLVSARNDLAQKEAFQKEMDAKVVQIQSAQKQVESTHDSAHGLFALEQIMMKFKLEPISGSKSLDIGARFKVHVASDSIDWGFSLTIHDPVTALVKEIVNQVWPALKRLPVLSSIVDLF
ncbi:g4182 [Coccomyxa viridis]|uniref:G4182 protein n=1 Tax=Coccomyxa viridis TaxID=1274662 RepID=A0ABP1FWL3_9CHLO